MKNDGRSLQKEIEMIADEYERRGIARLKKVDPPLKIIGTGIHRQTIFLDNPFVDFVGTWTARGGRGLFIEAKDTEEPTLKVLVKSGGLTEKQWQALLHWEKAGAACGILWRHRQQIRLVPVPAVFCQIRAGAKHVKWEHATPVPRGMGFVTFDFLHTLGEYYLKT